MAHPKLKSQKGVLVKKEIGLSSHPELANLPKDISQEKTFSFEEMMKMAAIMADRIGKNIGEQLGDKLKELDINPEIHITGQPGMGGFNPGHSTIDNDIIEIDGSIPDLTEVKEFNKSFDSIGKEKLSEIDDTKKDKLKALLANKKGK